MKKKLNKNSLQKYFVNQLTKGLMGTTDMNIVDFVQNICYNGVGMLYLPQKVILKSLYGEELTEEEENLITGWQEPGETGKPKTNWKKDRKYKHLVLCAGRRGSKALCLDTLIPTPTGVKPLKSINKGDYVIGPKGNSVKVLEESPIYYNNKCYKLTFCDGSQIIADAGHLWRTETYLNRKRPNLEKDVKTTQTIVDTLYVENKGEYLLNHSIELCEPINYFEKSLPIEPYALGCWMSLRDSKDLLTCDSALYNHIQDQLNKIGYKTSIVKEDKSYVSFSCDALRKDIEKHLISNRIPSDYIYGSINQRKELLKGITEGSYNYKFKDSVVFISSDTILTEDLYTIASSLGYYVEKSIKDNIVSLNIKSDKVILSSNLQRDSSKSRYMRRFIVSAEEIKPVPVKCLMVEGEYYLAGNNIITHNSTIASFIIAYEFYKLINMESPQIELGVLPNDPIDMFVIATSFEQVKQTIFGKIKGLFENSNYFNHLSELGEISIMEREIRFNKNQINIFAKHTNTQSLVGYGLKCLVLDEIARFENKVDPTTGEVESTAHELWNNVGKATTTFTKPGKHGIKLAISSAWEVGDPMESFEEMADKSQEILRFNLSTWDLNSGVKKSDYADEYCNNITKALLEYENIRPIGSGGFFDLGLLEGTQYPEYGSVIDTIETDKKVVVEDKETNRKKYIYYLINEVTRLEKLEDLNEKPAFLHVDFSKRRDATALSVARPRLIQLPGEDEPSWKIVIEALLKWQPFLGSDGYRREVLYEDVEKIIDLFIEDRKVKYLSFDTYNNSATLQKYQKKGLICTEASTTNKSQLGYFTLSKELFVREKLVLGKDNPNYGLVLQQLSQLIIHPETGKIKHGAIGKDLADALVNSVFECYNWMVERRLIGIKKPRNNNPVQSLGKQRPSHVTDNVPINKYKARTNLKNILSRK